MHKVTCVPNKGAIGKSFRKEAGAVVQALEDLSEDQVAALKKSLVENK